VKEKEGIKERKNARGNFQRKRGKKNELKSLVKNK
jgi:hypothetical protein